MPDDTRAIDFMYYVATPEFISRWTEAKKGELIWAFVALPRWQQAMFPVQYVGDFIGFWFKQVFFDKTGYEDPAIPNMDLRLKAYTELKKPRRCHRGD